MKEVVITDGQSLYDIALQEYGSTEAVFKIVEDNLLDGLNVELKAEQRLLIDTEGVVNKDVVAFYGTKTYRVNTSDTGAAGDFNDDFNEDHLI